MTSLTTSVAPAPAAATGLIQGNTPEPRPVHRHRLVFTGSGSEYFRIWIVNLLLTFLTAGLYYPWARVRKLKYFYSNTQVAGHALDFHGEPRRMLRGFLLTAGLFLAYSLAGTVSEAAGVAAAVILACVWPALLRASLQFRLGNTSWRGLRFRFTGSMRGAYLVFGVPLLVLAALAGAAGALMAFVGGVAGTGLAMLVLLGIYALLPYAYYRLKAYQQGHLAYAQLETSFRGTFGDVAKVFLRTGGVSVLAVLAATVLGGVLLVLTGTALPAGRPGPQAVLASVPLIALIIFVAQVVTLSYFQARMQNLLWTNTGGNMLRFKSDLAFLALARRMALNWVLMILTLGLYWPFAAVALARLKVQAVTLHARVEPDDLVSRLRPAPSDGAGDAAADLAGIDLGL